LEEGERKAKLEAVPRLLALGLSVDQVAGALDLAVKPVRQAANSSELVILLPGNSCCPVLRQPFHLLLQHH